MGELSNTIRRLSRGTRIFSRTDIAGFYDMMSQTITILSHDAPAVEAQQRAPEYPVNAREFLTTAIHELTHWLDHTTTLWGQDLLVETHNAISAFMRHEEDNFWRVAALDNRVRREALSDFYTVFDQAGAPAGDARDWMWQITCGLEYGADGRTRADRPIIFVVFNHVKGGRIARVPLTISSLIEANAVWAEYVVNSEIVATLPDDVRAVEDRLVRRSLMERLYTPELALYSAATHLVAGLQKNDRADLAYRAAAALSGLVLNLPNRLFAGLPVIPEMRVHWGDRVDALLAAHDRGFAYLLIAHVAPPITEPFSAEEWLEQCCRASGLPTMAEIRTETEEAFTHFPGMLLDGPLAERGRAQLELGRRNFQYRGIGPERPLSLDVSKQDFPMTLPPVVLADDTVTSIAANTVDNPLLAIGPSVQLVQRYQSWAGEFLRACRA